MVPTHYIFPYAVLTACELIPLSVAVILLKLIAKQASDGWMDGYKDGQTKPKYYHICYSKNTHRQLKQDVL